MGDVRSGFESISVSYLIGMLRTRGDDLSVDSADWLERLSARGAVPDGFVLVPREPTEEMIEAYHSVEAVTAASDEDADDKWAVESWRAMLAAAPQPAAVKQACGGDITRCVEHSGACPACKPNPQPKAKAGADVETEQSIKADCYDMIDEEIERHGVSTTSIVEYVTGLIERDAAQPKPAEGGAVADTLLRDAGLPKVADALLYSENFAEANPHLTQTAKEHIIGLCQMIRVLAPLANSAPAAATRAEEVEALSESDKDIAVAQAVEFAEYVSECAKGRMVEAAERFLSLPYSQEIARRLAGKGE